MDLLNKITGGFKAAGQAAFQRLPQLCLLLMVGVFSIFAAGGAWAQDPAPTLPLEIESFNTVINPTSMALAAGLLGGAALVAAFATGGGFRVAKKAYAWLFSKM